MKKITTTLFLSITIILGQPPRSQNSNLKFVFEPDSISLNVGESKELTVRLVDKDGKQAKGMFMVRGARKALSVEPRLSDSTGVSKVTVKAYKSGKLSVRAYARGVKGGYVSGRLNVLVPDPPLDRIVFDETIDKVYTGTTVNYSAKIYDEANLIRDDLEVKFSSSNKNTAEFDRFGNLSVKKAGRFTVTAAIENIEKTIKVSSKKNPVKSLKMVADAKEIRTGDVIKFTAKPLNSRGGSVKDVPVVYSFSGKAVYTDNFVNNRSSESVGLPAAGLITDEGKFVAETPGIYTITAQTSGFSAMAKVKVVPRNVQRRIEVVGHGTVSDLSLIHI